MAVPGLAALLSLLAVWLGAPTPAPEQTPRLSASPLTPSHPELRPAPAPAPSVPVLAAPPPAVLRLWLERSEGVWSLVWAEAPRRKPRLAMLSRWQLEG